MEATFSKLSVGGDQPSTMLKKDTEALEEYLKVVARRIIPSDAYMDYGKTVAKTVMELLNDKLTGSKYKIDRHYISGSVGKHTSVINADFDCVLFINEQTPLFSDVLDDFEKVLLRPENLKIVKINNLKKNNFTLQFDASLSGHQEIEIDLVPASNFIEKGKGHANLVAHQVWKTLEKIKQNPTEGCRLYSSSMIEATLEFSRRQSAFVHELARLAKFWNTTLHMGADVYVRGRSTFIELIAIDAGNEEENLHKAAGDRSFLRAFQRFLQRMAGYEQLKIQFTGKYNPLEGVAGIDASAWARAFTLAKHELPFVVDPSNPFYNFIKGIKPQTLEKFQRYAVETLHRMGVYKDTTGYLLFEVQPKLILPADIAQKWNTRSSMFLVGMYPGSIQLQPTMIMRDQTKANQLVGRLKGIETCLTTSVLSFVNNGSTKTNAEVQTLLYQVIDTNMLGIQPRTWPNAHGSSHENFDVTFVIPYELGEQKCMAKVSLKLD